MGWAAKCCSASPFAVPFPGSWSLFPAVSAVGVRGRRVRPIHRPWLSIAPALWAGVAGRHPPLFLVSPPWRASEVQWGFGAVKGQTVAVATWTKRGRRAGGAATSAWKAEAIPRLRGAKAHEMGLNSRGAPRPTFADRAHYCVTPWGKKTTVTTGWQATRGT